MDKYYYSLFVMLSDIAKNLGYNSYFDRNRNSSICFHLSKNIYISLKNGDKNSIYEFSHEIGHCIQFKRRSRKFNNDEEKLKTFYRERDKYKYKFMIDEFEAWIIGFYILYKNKIGRKGFWKHTFYCLNSHLKETKPNSVM